MVRWPAWAALLLSFLVPDLVLEIELSVDIIAGATSAGTAPIREQLWPFVQEAPRRSGFI